MDARIAQNLLALIDPGLKNALMLLEGAQALQAIVNAAPPPPASAPAPADTPPKE